MTILDQLVAVFPVSIDDAMAYKIIGVWVAGVLVILFPPWRKKRPAK
jgi:hypothetical protein